ncbi:MAG: bifunctional phosphoribosylaminoimidazolecarboxamide formyltransferase/IMP cyclohydrolase, partial [Aquisalinus sp.]|nr:bifunctional phosphoribosylaminoimidazolecarboxamide formyltransferase/IMP cyclohydrolase [Aquisalinus sp.]
MTTSDTFAPVRRALISVSDKAGVAEFATALAKYNVEIVSTGGTAKLLRDQGLTVLDVADLTGFPEMMDGRVKTLHPSVHGGLLALRNDETHVSAMQAHDILPIDLLVVNLYPFEKTVATGADYDTAIENVDIGGPAMIRAAAKNHAHVGVVTDPDDYADVLEELRVNNGLSERLRRRLAANAYARTAAYDSAISNWFAKTLEIDTPRRVTIAGTLRQTLRYGENPHQEAAFYVSGDVRPGVATARQVQGKELSYNNINDTDAAFELVAEFNPDTPAVAIIKHANPCGVATGSNIIGAYKLALRCDPVSAFGGIVALNQRLTGEAAQEIAKIFTEVVIAPDVEEEALAIFAKKKNVRILLTDGLPDTSADYPVMRAVSGGFLW